MCHAPGSHAMQVTAMPPDVSKAQAWMLWKFFHHLMLGPIHSGKLRWNLKMPIQKRKLLFKLQTIHFRIPCWFLVFFFCPELLGNKLKVVPQSAGDPPLSPCFFRFFINTPARSIFPQLFRTKVFLKDLSVS